jgi:hypothetical protein
LKNFESRLPADTKKKKAVEKEPSVVDYLVPEDRQVAAIPYSDRALETAAFEWVIETNQVRTHYYFCLQYSYAQPLQPIQTFKNAAFKKMLDIAS